MNAPVCGNEREIEAFLSTPGDAVMAAVRRLPGDFVVLGAGGKIGTTLAMMLRRALDAAGRPSALVTAVSRFSREEIRRNLENAGVRTQRCDLAEAEEVKALPEAAQVLFLAGQKFGTEADPEPTWIQNTVVPALVARRYARAGVVAFSTGCVYPFVSVRESGSVESDAVAFTGEYASTCIGRERVFSYYSRQLGTRGLILRLNYAVELRYGVLVDIAAKVLRNEPVDVSTGWFNCIWQGDACAQAIRCLEHVRSPCEVLNVTGSEKLSVREVAADFGRRFGVTPRWVGREMPTAWLANAGKAREWFGPPAVSVPEMIGWVADYLQGGGALLGKPTHFESRSGSF